jgi:hypothetical protein
LIAVLLVPAKSLKQMGKPMKIGAFLVAAGLLLQAGVAAAGSNALNGDELRKAVSGKTVFLNISGFELPIRYDPSGRMSGKMGTVAASFSRGDGSQDTGKWWVSNDQLCQQWHVWLDSKTFCYRLTQNGSIVHWTRDDGHSGTARIGG